MEIVGRTKDVEQILYLLKENYPNAYCTLNFHSPFQLLVATILSAQCTDDRVNKVTIDLFPRFPEPKDFADADLAVLENAIRSTGFFRQKAKNIKQASELILKDFDGEVPQNMSDLIKLPGVGRKTANVILGTAFRKNEGIVVDTHVKRISNKLGLTSHSIPERIEKDLMRIIPKSDWTLYSHLLIEHGRAICKARTPRCERCFLAHFCFFYKNSN